MFFRETVSLYTENHKSINTIIERNADLLNVTEPSSKGWKAWYTDFILRYYYYTL